jgi:membrane protease YdiL (CAAX protease family)
MKHLSFWLPIRSIAFLLVFIACAGILDKDLSETACWWSVIAVILNFLTIGLLVFLAKRNGQSYWQLINYQKGKTSWKQILEITLLVLVVGMSGMYLAGFLCYNNFLYAPPVMITPIPKMLAIVNVVLLPVTTTFAEDGLYLGCGVNQIKNKHAAIIVPAFFYALQHCFIPTLLDGQYIVYRFISFLPLTLILCWYYYRKRNPLPIMVGHALIDLATAAQIVATSFVPELYQTMCGQ